MALEIKSSCFAVVVVLIIIAAIVAVVVVIAVTVLVILFQHASQIICHSPPNFSPNNNQMIRLTIQVE